MKKVTEDNPFTQLCVWPACVVGKEKIAEFEAFMTAEFNGTRVKYAEEVLTLPDVENGKAVPDTGGRNDLFFFVHTEDIGKFAVPRLAYEIRWWEDVLDNGGGDLYPPHILKKYPYTWGRPRRTIHCKEIKGYEKRKELGHEPLKLMRWSDLHYPPLDLNENVKHVNELIEEVKKLRHLLKLTGLERLTEPFQVLDALGGKISGDYEKDLKRLKKKGRIVDVQTYDDAYQMDQQP